MGFFDKMFSARKDFPTLDPENPAAQRLERIREQLKTLSDQVHKPLEVIPGEEQAYVFIGKPPKNFGIAWIEGEKIKNFKTLAEEKNVDPQRLEAAAQKLRAIYEANQNAPHFLTRIGKEEVVVTPSAPFGKQVGEVIREVAQ